MITKICLWWLRKRQYWSKISTIKGYKRDNKLSAEDNHRLFTTHERARHSVLWELLQ